METSTVWKNSECDICSVAYNSPVEEIINYIFRFGNGKANSFSSGGH
jgi:hypothetical protein